MLDLALVGEESTEQNLVPLRSSVEGRHPHETLLCTVLSSGWLGWLARVWPSKRCSSHFKVRTSLRWTAERLWKALSLRRWLMQTGTIDWSGLSRFRKQEVPVAG